MKKVFILLSSILLLTACGNDSPVEKPTDVRNDSTGNWKKATTSEDIDILDYAEDYSDEHMEDGDTQFIIYFTKNTTSVLDKLDGLC